MGTGPNHETFRQLQMLFDVGTSGVLTDRQLLERFTSRRTDAAERAFAALVERHGPMVLRVCRAVLGDVQEADDAFQATFLVLVRRAKALWIRDSLGPWLHQVAYRVACCARSAAARRRKHEQKAASLVPSEVREAARDDVGDVLHEEIDRLPHTYRVALLLCYFEGLSPEQAARQLGWPIGTVQSRLARGRERLRTRLTRRGLAPTLGVAAITSEATSASLPNALLGATLRTAMGFAAGEQATAGALSTSVTKLTQGVLKAMLWTKLRTAIIAMIAIAALTSGAGALLLQDAPPPASDPVETARSDRGALPRSLQPPRESGPVPKDLKWDRVPPDGRLRIAEILASGAKSHYERLKTWRGSYSCIDREYLDERFIGQVFIQPGQPKPEGGPLIQESDSLLTFAIDAKASASYRSKVTRTMRFLKARTDKEVPVPLVSPSEHRRILTPISPSDHRCILTPNRYLTFRPKDISTSGFLRDLPEAQEKNHAEEFPVAEARSREGGEMDPLGFFKFDPVNTFWSELELLAESLKGGLGAESKTLVESRLKVDQADGPDGRWYRVEMTFGAEGTPALRVVTTWSPQAGHLAVQRVYSIEAPDQPEGKLASRVDWRWKTIGSVEIPSQYDEINYDQTTGRMSRERHATLGDCVVNGPLDPHQFDERGLGLRDGDLILNQSKRVAYIMKSGKSVKLADFGQGSILETPKPAPPRGDVRRPSSPGKIYTTASLGTNSQGLPIDSVVAIDPTTGQVSKVFEGSPGRLRISPDGRNAAFVRGGAVWVRSLDAKATPRQVTGLDSDGGGCVPSWSSDGKQLIVSVGVHDDQQKRWVFKTIRVNVDGSGREPLPIPAEDGVEDWSPDGKWLLIASSRNAKIGWQLYLMHPDGTEPRQITEGGNPFFARFSPDSRRVLYSDGPGESRRGAWVVDIDGKSRRHVFPTGKHNGSGCWSPDGSRIAFAIDGDRPEDRGRLEVVDLEGKHETLLTFPGQRVADKPDWR